ncbi:FadR/GntR family transcriptional regulator [Natranaerobius thermophilus]|uniref:GntR domain protein n=1 Tax=Natranaerobius thermophilus (strain ATCC BAA-1301 / DSM 18059 / JW/NM-WN-LF) TaxID=457570 RepID=B2A839_NATTJ|nr:FadR/GntR family transcriptional regulator [Natranaerobius thermophilus]ACB85807.1 GntR domain protein [Natranaerobius thermophilus JW/NM-WN-LF]
MEDWNIKKLKTTSLSDRVIDQIIDLIVQGKLKPGNKLPSERELVELFGVSRSSIREALKTLEKINLLKSVPGRGVYLSSEEDEGSVSALAYPLLLTNDIEELFEARELIQVEMARKAAKRATEEDIKNIREVIRKASQAETKSEKAELDVEFDLNLAKAARNSVLLKFLISIQEVLRLTQLKFITEERYTKSINDHTKIVDFVEKGKPEEAAEAMRVHLISVKDDIN